MYNAPETWNFVLYLQDSPACLCNKFRYQIIILCLNSREIWQSSPWLVKNVSRYVKSRSDKQLRSRASENDTSSCDPEDVTSNKSAIVPCGLIAWSLFNDTYGFSVNNTLLGVSKKNIAWKSDQQHKFGSDVYPKNFQSGGLIGGAKLNSSIPVNIPLFFIWTC